MSAASNISDPAGPSLPPDPFRAHHWMIIRILGISFVAILGIGFAVWAVTQYQSRRMVVEPGTVQGPQPVPAAGGEGEAVQAVGDPSQPGMVNVYVVVRVREESGDDLAVGSYLSRRVGLTLVGKEGQPYEAQFDRVGVWLMEIPFGEYEVPPEQTELKKWRWKLSGPDVTEAEKGYTVELPEGQATARLELLLYR